MVLKLDVRKIVTESTPYAALFDTNADARIVVANLHFVFVTSAKEVLFLLALVCLLAGLHKVAHNAGIV